MVPPALAAPLCAVADCCLSAFEQPDQTTTSGAAACGMLRLRCPEHDLRAHDASVSTSSPLPSGLQLG